MTWIEQFKKDFTKNQLLYILIVVIVGLALRWMQLDIRPLHHDESLHALYGANMFQNPDRLFYRYDPMLHGPLLYHLLPFIYELFGMSKFTIRILPALLSTLLLLFPFSFYQKLNRRSFLLLLTFFSLSPSLVYWGRFLREDGLMLGVMMIGSLAFISKRENIKAFAILNLLLIPFLIKESAYIHPVLFIVFLIVDYIFEKDKTNSFMIHLKRIFIQGKKGLLVALALNIFLFTYLYTGGFKWGDGFYTNMLTTGFSYWFSQHKIERIPGPFIYQTLILSSYDFVFFLSLIFCSVHLYFNSFKKLKIFWILTIFLMTLTYPIVKNIDFANNSLWEWSKFKITADFYLCIFIFLQGVISTVYLLKNQKKILAFLNYLFWSFLFTYSFLGERVPWLASYSLFFGLIFVSFYLNELSFINNLKFRYLLIITFIFTLRISLKTNFSEAGANNQLISQVHTSAIFEKILFKIKNEMEFPIKSQPKLLALGETVWPTSYFFLGEPTYYFNLGNRELTDFTYILSDIPNLQLDSTLSTEFQKNIIPMRVWWLPDFSTLNLYNWIKYAITHNPWNDPGAKDVALYIKVNSK